MKHGQALARSPWDYGVYLAQEVLTPYLFVVGLKANAGEGHLPHAMSYKD